MNAIVEKTLEQLGKWLSVVLLAAALVYFGYAVGSFQASMEARLTSMEARLTAVEARLTSLEAG